MKVLKGEFRVGLMGLVLLAMSLTGCATYKVDWSPRVGNYTYDQAVLELGPPERYANLKDGTTVAEWLTRRGYTHAYSPFYYGYYPGWCGPYYSTYVDTYSSPDYFLRLTFGPDGKLKAWKYFYR